MNSLVDRAARDGGDAAAAIDHEGLGEAEDAELVADVAGAVAQHRVGEAVLGGEVAGVAGDVLDVDAEHGGVALLEALVPALEEGRLGAAGLAPGGPEVEDDDLAPVVGERAVAAAGQAGQVDLRRRLAPAGHQGLLDAAVRLVAGEPVREQRDERDDDAQNGDRNGARQPAHDAARRLDGG